MTDQPTDDERFDELERRAAAYKLLSECFHEPDAELIELLNETADESLPVDAGALSEAVPEDVKQLRVDYAKLFVGPFDLLAPPYGSVYLDDSERVMTESTTDVIEWYRREGLDVGMDEPADHVAAELEFLYALVAMEAEAVDESNGDAAREYREKQARFIATHLGRWIEEFTESVASNAETEFYRALAEETAGFVRTDRDRLVEQFEERTDRTDGGRSTPTPNSH